MTDTIEPGDLIRWGDGNVAVALLPRAAEPWTLIAKGPGWTRHDGSSVNPVPGAECVVHGDMLWHTGKPSETWVWDAVQFYRVTCPSQEELSGGRVVSWFEWETPAPSQPPAPQPGWVATVQDVAKIERGNKVWLKPATVKAIRYLAEKPTSILYDWGGGYDFWVNVDQIDRFEQPPPPPPWEPEIGEMADWYGTPVTLRGVHGLVAWVEKLGGIFETVSIANLRQPPKGGEA